MIDCLDVVEVDGRVLVDSQRSIKQPGLWLAGYGDWTGPGSATLMGAARTAPILPRQSFTLAPLKLMSMPINAAAFKGVHR